MKTYENVYNQFREYGKNAKKWLNKCVILLPEVERLRIWEKKGFENIYDFAMKLAGMSRNKVNEGLRVMKKTENLPEIRKIVEDRGIWAAKPLVQIAKPETEKFWAEKAESMTQKALQIYIKDRRGAAAKNSTNSLPQSNQLQKITLELTPKTAKLLLKQKGLQNWESTIQQLLSSQKSNIIPQKPQKIQTRSRHIPIPIKKYIQTRSKGLCEHPNCTNNGLHLHHATPFSICHEHDPDHIHLLCPQHHEIAHNGLIANEDLQPANWRTLSFPDLTDIKNTIKDRIAKFKFSPG